MLKYRFSINGHEVNPSWPDDLLKEYELESGEMFYRANLSGKIKFVGADFAWLSAQAFDTEFVVLLEKYDGGWSEYWSGKFSKTDGSWNEDDEYVEVKMSIKDGYTKVLAGLEYEYNLIKLAPAKVLLEIQKRPLIQTYVPGASVVGCFLAGMYWEQETTDEITDETALVNDYYFALNTDIKKISVTGTGTPTGAVGDYSSTDGLTYDQGLYRIVRAVSVSYNLSYGFKVTEQYTLSLISTGSSLFVSPTYTTINKKSPKYYDGAIAFTATGAGAGTLTGYNNNVKIYMRLLTDSTDILGTDTYELPEEDLVADNRNYSRALGYALGGVYLFRDTQVDPTEFGLADDGTYFVQAAFSSSTGIGKLLPIARSSWGQSSLWFAFSFFTDALDVAGREAYTLKDASPISSVISVLLGEIDSSITHEATTEYSSLLYGSPNPVTGGDMQILITQKSNILAGEYDQPAQTATTTLASVLGMLKNTMQAYWYIEDSKLKIEHISFFKNGGSYSGSPLYTADLTALKSLRNGKTWGYAKNAYTYDKEQLAERMTFSWMDDVSTGFAGYPIEINSNFVQDGKIDEITPGAFTSDIDYMLLNPEEISSDGFALFAAVDGFTALEGTAEAQDGYYWYNTGVFTPVAGYKSVSFPIDNTTDKVVVTSEQQGTALALAVYCDALGNYLGYEIKGTTAISYTRFELSPIAGTGIIKLSSYSTTPVLERKAKVLPFITREIDGLDVTLQNGYMSWVYLHPNFWVDNLPSTDVTINLEPGYVTGVQRRKKQNVKYPSMSDPDPMKLIKTALGDGQIEKLSVNLSSRMNNITLKYDTE